MVRLGRLGAVMATRVQNVQNGQKNVTVRLSPLCMVRVKNVNPDVIPDEMGMVVQPSPARSIDITEDYKNPSGIGRQAA